MSTRVLVIDDEPNVRRMVRIALEADGYQVDEASDGASGVELYGDGSRFDVVLLDQKMPGMDGIQTLREIRRRKSDAPVVMATAYGSLELAVDALRAGATDFLKKPLTPDLLRGAMLAALGKGTPIAPPNAPIPPQPEPAPADVWTVNGFFIRALPPDDISSANEYRFAVTHAGTGPNGDVVVAISEAEMSRVTRLARRTMPPGGPFWQQQAERALMNFLFREATLPPDGRLAVNSLSDEAVLLARNWSGK